MSGVALVTGAAGGIGSALVRRLVADAWEVVGVDVDEEGLRDLGCVAEPADVSRADEWERLAARLQGLELACLNAGVLTGTASVADLDESAYRRALGVNVDGVVFGVRALLPLLERSRGTIVVTASLAGLVPMESDPVYALTKHAVVGFVRSIAPQLEQRGVRIVLVNPGIADTPMVRGPMREALEAARFPLLRPDDVVAAIVHAIRVGRPGEAFAVQPGREPVSFRFPNVPGPRVAGAERAVPPPLPG
ncbi:MAG TPA: SDR family oxidoreductase [Gaiellaceae bacterium]|nr:SDR family oxidoreductase [Gaiellaceae bacterium]